MPTDRWYYDTEGHKRHRSEQFTGGNLSCCGMPTYRLEYHPNSACMMYQQCHDGDLVRSHLYAVVEWARKAEGE